MPDPEESTTSWTDTDRQRGLDDVLVDRESMRSVLTKVADLAVELLTGDLQASVTLVERGRPTTASWTGLLAFELDETQFALGDGPCVHSALSGEQVVIDDMQHEDRWPRFTAQAERQGAVSSLSTPIPLQNGLRGALNLYAPTPGVFDRPAQALVRGLTERAAAAISNMHSYERAQRTAVSLQAAMESRATIEQAKGLLMGRHRISADQAFEMLSTLSQNSNRKLRDLAAELVADATRPEDDA